VNQKDFRAFELLKLIRDKKISNISEFLDYMYHHDPYLFPRGVWRWQRELEALRLIEVNDLGETTSTEGLSRLVNSLDISLTLLAKYSGNSIICSPIFGRPSNPSANSDVFVIMPFLKDLKPVYEDHIRNTVQELHLSIARGDDFFTAKSVMSDIWDAINSCRIVIADCTGRNPNVFYEIGMAHTLGKPVILISQNKDDIPFDIQHIRYIIYEFTPRGMSEFEKKLAATISSELEDEFSYEKIVAQWQSGHELS